MCFCRSSKYSLGLCVQVLQRTNRVFASHSIAKCDGYFTVRCSNDLDVVQFIWFSQGARSLAECMWGLLFLVEEGVYWHCLL